MAGICPQNDDIGSMSCQPASAHRRACPERATERLQLAWFRSSRAVFRRSGHPGRHPGRHPGPVQVGFELYSLICMDRVQFEFYPLHGAVALINRFRSRFSNRELWLLIRVGHIFDPSQAFSGLTLSRGLADLY